MGKFLRGLVGAGAMLGVSLLANPIVVLKRPPESFPIAHAHLIQGGIALFALVLEAHVLGTWLRYRNAWSWGSILRSFLLTHLVSFPITLLLAQILGWRAELFPLVFEVWFFPQVMGVSVRSSWKAVQAANGASFVAGVLLTKGIFG